MSRLIIFGGKGTAVNVAELIYDAQHNYNMDCEFLGFAFDDKDLGNLINGFPVLCNTREAYEKYKGQKDVKFLFLMHHQNKMKERAALIKSYDIPLEKWGNFVHPSSFVSKSVELGNGNVVASHCAIHANVKIGNFCTFSGLTTIGHDTIIKNNVFTGTHVCIGSSVKINDYNFLGQNSTISTNVQINEENILGLGCCVHKKIKDTKKVFIGNPARLLIKN